MHISVIPQLLTKRDGYGNVRLPFIKIVDDISCFKKKEALREWVKYFIGCFGLGTISHGPGITRLIGRLTVQHSDYCCSIHAVRNCLRSRDTLSQEVDVERLMNL